MINHGAKKMRRIYCIHLISTNIQTASHMYPCNTSNIQVFSVKSVLATLERQQSSLELISVSGITTLHSATD